jgi:hypothetical protein
MEKALVVRLLGGLVEWNLVVVELVGWELLQVLEKAVVPR